MLAVGKEQSFLVLRLPLGWPGGSVLLLFFYSKPFLLIRMV